MKTYTLFGLLVRRSLTKYKRNILSFVALLLMAVSSQAQSADIIFDPATTNVGLGQTFTVKVRAHIISGSLDFVQIHFNFDKTKLAVTSITKLSGAILPNEFFALQSVSTINTNGQVNYAAGTSADFPTSDFDILSITFNTLQSGSTALTFRRPPTTAPLTNAIRSGVSILNSVVNGTINITCTPPTATIEAIAGCNGQPTSLRLSAATGTGPFDLTVNGTVFNDKTVSATPFGTLPFPTYKLWPANPTPPNPNTQDDGDGQALHIGTKFKSTQAGFIKGIRFYSGNVVSGTYKGKLWKYDPPSSLMQSATFTSVSANGWNEITFTTPVAIAPNVMYVATIYSSAGKYVSTENYFTTPLISAPLTAVGSTSPTADMNGIYFKGTEAAANATMSGGGFGNWANYNRANYWVDVMFVANVNTITLTNITDAVGCSVTGTLQTINTFSPDCSTLPVTLTDLSATPQGSKITVSWRTSSEINNLGFDVQRSTNGADWTTIGFVAGAGTSNSSRTYSYPDHNVEPRKYYYKLKQIDIDQRFKYSSIVTATLAGKADFVLEQNFPNPFTSQTTIQFSIPRRETVNISLYDMNGRVLRTLVNGTKETGSHVVNLNIGTLPKGIYYYKMQAGDFSAVKKLTIQ